MKKAIGQQGEVSITMIDAIPENIKTQRIQKESAKGFIISHSEKGHHHILTGGDVMERVENVPAGMKVFYAILDEPEEMIQDAPNAHESHKLDAGIYEFRISRQYDPFMKQAKKVAD